MCFMFSSRSVSFTEKRREAAHKGDHSIDYINPAVAANAESDLDDENLGINANAFPPLPLVLVVFYISYISPQI